METTCMEGYIWRLFSLSINYYFLAIVFYFQISDVEELSQDRTKATNVFTFQQVTVLSRNSFPSFFTHSKSANKLQTISHFLSIWCYWSAHVIDCYHGNVVISSGMAWLTLEA